MTGSSGAHAVLPFLIFNGCREDGVGTVLFLKHGNFGHHLDPPRWKLTSVKMEIYIEWLSDLSNIHGQ